MTLVPARRRAAVAVATTAVASAAAAFSLAAPTAASASTANTHAYRHGAVLTVQATRDLYNGHAARPGGGGGKSLSYRGGTASSLGSVGVTTGSEKVYLVFWGSQWGSATRNSDGTLSFGKAGDPSGEAARVQSFFQNLGSASLTNQGDLWSNVMTQYCEGVAAGTQSCAGVGRHVAYPSQVGVLAGVFYDGTSAAPGQATAAELAQEAVWGSTQGPKDTSRDAQYVILSPTGTHPDGFNTSSANFCAWHDWTGDGYGISSPALAFSNDPYVTDMGASCGANFVNKTGGTIDGSLDGVTIVFGHEYAETITDQFPAGGWLDQRGYENADKCAWLSSGTGKSQNVTFNGTKFPVQSTWSNATGGCAITAPSVYS